jgi:hypothetical protein
MRAALLASLVLLLQACGGGAATTENATLGSGSSGSGTDAPVTPAPPAATNHAPTISGTAPTQAQAGQAFTFVPTANDADGDRLTYSISNKPTWASFDAGTGRLTGTAVAGAFTNIVITVSDGQSTASLAGFTVNVSAAASAPPSPATGSATLAWMPPTQRTDGTSLNNLAGYRIHYGLDAGSLENTVTVSNPGLATYQVDNLGSGTYYFVVVAYDTAGIESTFSTVVSKKIS